MKQTNNNVDKGHIEQAGIFGQKTEIILSVICGIFLGLGFLIQNVFPQIPGWVSIVLYIFSYIFGGYYTFIEAYDAISKGKFEIDFLMLVAAIGAAALGQWPEGALLLFLFSLGHALEHMAMNKARKSIEALAGLSAKTAIVRRNGIQEEIPVEQLLIGDIVIVKPNSKMPADGVVVAGNSSVNQAPITGESVPVDKMPVDNPDADFSNDKKKDAAHTVFAGSINGAGVLEIKVLKEAKDSTLSRVVQMVKEAEQQQSPTQQFTKKIERYYVPAVLILVSFLIFAFLVIDEPFSKSFYRAMAVLVAASPCALAISTPSAVLSGVARAARQGVLIKGGKPLEDLGVLTALAFDKTGTLTEGKPVLNKIIVLNGTTEEDLLTMAVAVERLSDHPLASAIVKGGMQKLNGKIIPEATNLKAVMGRGVQADINGSKVIIGNDEIFKENNQSLLPQKIIEQVTALQYEGNTTMIIKNDDNYIGIIGVMDIPRPEAKEVLLQLKRAGIKKMVMLTGDNQRVADAVAKQIGITEAYGDLLPEEKVAAIDKLMEKGNKLAMIGDGVNDAPAMAKSTVGIAMGAAGSDVALETADIALMGDKLSLLPFAIGLSRKSKSIIRQNLFISLGMVAVLIPLTMSGIASMGPAVIGHEGSTLLVVLNALRLLGYKSKQS
ncbi:MAG TPA: heavy metal translocating P-type ATPase [Chitinophagaceae bacterium]|nr:heavy metal translocating P-type ATPase [Chitinophagaceae bacterium]